MLKFFNRPRTIKPLSRKKQSIRHLILWGTLALTINSVHAMEDSDERKSPYLLGAGKKAAERLTEQNEFLEALSREHLAKAWLSAGQIVWDVGCGSGDMTKYLATIVGEKGHVYAIDNNKEQLDIIESMGLKNVTCILGDAQSLENLKIPRPHLFYIRFLSMHMSNPEKLMRQLKEFGGVVAAQEPIMSSAIYNNLPRYKETLTAVAERFGLDFDIGKRLSALYQEAGFSCTVEEHQPMPNPRQAKGVNLKGFNALKEKAFKVLIQENRLKQEQVEEWERTLNSWPETEEGDITPYYTPPMNVYVIATKKD